MFSIMVDVRRTSGEDEWKKHLEIRKAVFIDEMGIPEKEDRDKYDTSAKCYLAFNGAQAIGTARFRETSKGMKIERVAVLPEFRNKGVATAIVQEIIKDIPKELVIFAQVQDETTGFFEKLGFKIRGEALWIANILHRYMKYYPNTSSEF
jgi:predicted GNAT family N-acyltransferase